jgi:hypothetical protein
MIDYHNMWVIMEIRGIDMTKQHSTASLDLEYLIADKDEKSKIKYLEDMQKAVLKILASLKGYDHG